MNLQIARTRSLLADLFARTLTAPVPDRSTEKAFCSTGSGGGVDPTCAPGGDGESDSGASVAAQVVSGDVPVVRSLFPRSELGVRTRSALVYPGKDVEQHLEFFREKLAVLGYKEVNATSLENEDIPAITDSGEVNFESGSKALNVYMRTDGKQTVVTFDETPMDQGGRMHRNDNYVPDFVRDLVRRKRLSDVQLSPEEKRQISAMLVDDVRKAASEPMYILSPVLVPETTDLQGDVISASEIQNAARQWMAHSQAISLMHRRTLGRNQVQVVENYVLLYPQTFGTRRLPAGTWMVGLHVLDEELKDLIRQKKLTGISIGGKGERVSA